MKSDRPIPDELLARIRRLADRAAAGAAPATRRTNGHVPKQRRRSGVLIVRPEERQVLTASGAPVPGGYAAVEAAIARGENRRKNRLRGGLVASAAGRASRPTMSVRELVRRGDPLAYRRWMAEAELAEVEEAERKRRAR
jgi:hypothetical protein